jgi:hypothetical protein
MIGAGISVGKLQLTLTNLRDGSLHTIEVDPDASVEEVANLLRQRGVIQPAEAVVFYRMRSGGGTEPLNPSTASDIQAVIVSGGRVAFEARRMQGGWSDYSRVIREVAKRRGLKLQGGIAYGYFRWRRGNDIYTVFITPPEIPGNPPKVIICPYPYYVKIYDEFEENHARSCCWEENIGGTICGYWHVQVNEYRDLLLKVRDPVLVTNFILDSAIQALQLHRVWLV